MPRKRGERGGTRGNKARGISKAESLGLGNHKNLGAKGVSYLGYSQVTEGKIELA